MKTQLRITGFSFLLIIGLTQISFGQCNAKYASLPYTQSFESWINLCGNDSASPDSSWVNSNPDSITNPSEAAWRRDDYSLWIPTTVWFYPPAAVGNFSARFHTHLTNATYPDSENLDLYVNCSVQGIKQLSFYYINAAGLHHMDIYLSTDSGATFTAIGQYTTNVGWTQYSLTLPSNSPKTIIRFTGISVPGSNGQTDFGLDYVQVLSPCQGKPTAGTIITQQCPGESLMLSGSSQALGLAYMWQQSGDGVTWSFVTADTTPILNVLPYTSTYYRAIVTCNGSGLSDTTLPVKLQGMGSFYMNVPYTEDFESWGSRCDSLDVPDTGWTNNPVMGDESWRRDDQGEAANWDDGQASNISGGLWYNNGYGTEAFSGNHSAAFNASSSLNSGTLNIYVNCSTTPGTKQLSFYYINPDDVGDSMNVYISTDGGTTFSPSLITCLNEPYTTVWKHYLVPINSDSERTVISFVASAFYVDYDMGLDYVQVFPPCQGKPTAGMASASTTLVSACDTGRSILTLSGLVSNVAGLTYQWQSSLDSINWTNVIGGIGADSNVYITDTIKATTFYRCIVSCSNSGESDTSHKAEVTYLPVCYCAPQTLLEDGDNIGNVTIKYDSAVILNNGIDSPAIQPSLLTTGIPYVNYGDSGIIIKLQQGLTYTIATTLITDTAGANYPDTAYVFIDYNQDGEWESTERVWSAPYNLPTSIVPVPTTGTFTVPLTADTGITEMRVQSSYENAVDTPCNNNNNRQGETEDYLVYITAKAKPSGISQVSMGNGSINLYPDPFSNQVTLYFSGIPSGNFNLAVTNTLGQQLMAYSDYTDGSGYKRTIDLHTLPAGVYFISVIINGNNYVTKMVKMD